MFHWHFFFYHLKKFVLKVEKTRTYFSGLGQPSRQDFKYYKVKLDILNITTYKQEGFGSCDSSYVEKVEQSGAFLTLAEYEKNPIKEGQKIKAKIHFGGDEWFGGYFLSDIQILEDATTSQVELSYWYCIIPIIIILLALIFYALFKKIKKWCWAWDSNYFAIYFLEDMWSINDFTS